MKQSPRGCGSSAVAGGDGSKAHCSKLSAKVIGAGATGGVGGGGGGGGHGGGELGGKLGGGESGGGGLGAVGTTCG